MNGPNFYQLITDAFLEEKLQQGAFADRDPYRLEPFEISSDREESQRPTKAGITFEIDERPRRYPNDDDPHEVIEKQRKSLIIGHSKFLEAT